MKYLKISTLILFLLTFFLCRNSFAKEYKMVFWYPGEAGSTEEAQNTLDTFFEEINKSIMPDKLSGKYFNTVEAGINYIKQSKPKLGIISFSAYTINKDKLGANEPFLKTVTLPEGKTTETYYLVGKGTKPSNFNCQTEFFTKQPLNIELLKKITGFTDCGAKTKITVVQNMIPKLKEISEGKTSFPAILQPAEFFTIKNISLPWTKNIATWAASPPIPSAPFIYFGEKDPFYEKLKGVLLKMDKTEEGKATLSTLRLKGFAEYY